MAGKQQRFVWSLVLGSILAFGMPSQGQAPKKGGGIWQNMPFIALVNGHFQGTSRPIILDPDCPPPAPVCQ